MNPDTFFPAAIPAGIAAIVLFHFCWRVPRLRRRRLAQTAVQLGLIVKTTPAQLPFGAREKLLFFGRADPGGTASRRFLSISLERTPRYASRVASPVLAGRLGQKELAVCDVTILHPREANSTQTVAIFKLAQPIFKFTLEARHAERFTVKFTHLGEYMEQRMRHYRKVELPALASNYVIRSPETPHIILSHLGDKIVRYFSRHKGWFLEGGEDLLLVYRRGKRVKPNRLEDFLQETGRIAALIGETFSH